MGVWVPTMEKQLQKSMEHEWKPLAPFKGYMEIHRDSIPK